MCLDLTCVLQFSYPVRFFFLQAGHLSLNLNSSLVFFVDSADEVQPLLLSFQGVFLGSQLFLLLLLASNHVFHSLRFKLVRLLLHLDHLLMLLTLLL
jgi:hypothetical protein